jgi:hypothetical protein
MKLKRLKDEYVNVRKELYNHMEENTKLQHELVECRFKLEYYSQMNNQTIHSIQTVSFKGNHFFVNEFFLGN